MTKKALLSMLIIVVAAAMIGMGTYAYFVDTETSNDNTLTAGVLELTIDGVNDNVVKFTVPKMVPDNQVQKSWVLKNEGNINGYLDISSLVVTSLENTRWEAEEEAGDTTTDVGELAGILGFRLYNDVDKDGYFSTGDYYIHSGHFSDAASEYNENLLIPAGNEVRITAIIDWWRTDIDSQAMSDSVQLDMTFELGQTAGQ